MNKPNDPLGRLANLVSHPENMEVERGEEFSIEVMDEVLKFVADRTNRNIFDMQALLSACENELRLQIREMVEGEDQT